MRHRPSSSTAKKKPGEQSLEDIEKLHRRLIADGRPCGGADAAPPDGELAREVHAPARSRLQVLRRADRIPDRAGPDRRRRAERLRQVEPGRGAPLGDGRELLQEHARLGHGRRHLLGQRQPAGAQYGRGDRSPSTMPTARRPPPSTTPSCSRSPAASSARPDRSTASTAATCGRATSSCSSPTPRPAPIRRRWSARAGSAS